MNGKRIKHGDDYHRVRIEFPNILILSYHNFEVDNVESDQEINIEELCRDME